MRIFDLSYAWRVKDEGRYLKCAKHELIVIPNYTDRNPSHFLDGAEMTITAKIGYDTLHLRLSDRQRTKFWEAIVQKGLKAYLDQKYKWWLVVDLAKKLEQPILCILNWTVEH